MHSVKRMIDRALVFCSTRTAIAARLGVTPQRLNDWESGRRSMPDEALIELAHIGGKDPKLCLGEYHLERHEKKRAGALAGIAAVAFSVVAAVAPLSDARAATSGQRSTHYAKWRRLFASLMRRDDRRSPFATCSQATVSACKG